MFSPARLHIIVKDASEAGVQVFAVLEAVSGPVAAQKRHTAGSPCPLRRQEDLFYQYNLESKFNNVIGLRVDLVNLGKVGGSAAIPKTALPSHRSPTHMPYFARQAMKTALEGVEVVINLRKKAGATILSFDSQLDSGTRVVQVGAVEKVCTLQPCTHARAPRAVAPGCARRCSCAGGGCGLHGAQHF